MKPSLRRRLMWLLSSAVLLAWAATAFFTYFDARQQISQMLDTHLVQSAGLVALQLEHEADALADCSVAREYKRESLLNCPLMHFVVEAIDGFIDIILTDCKQAALLGEVLA